MNKRRMQYIGMRLRKERRLRNKTLEQVADAVGLKKNTISAYEKGKIAISLDNLDDICTYFNMNYLDLLSDVQKQLQEDDDSDPDRK